jgi:ribose 5-phosphate isomerase B
MKKNGVKNMIAIGSDHGGYRLKEEIKKYLDEKQIQYKDLGCMSEERVDYPNIAKAVAKCVQSKECDRGILICRSGIGMSVCANKFKGIICTPCHNEYTAKYSKLHNNSNILAIGADDVTTNEAICILRMWLATEFEGGRHLDRIKIIEQIEKENMK